MYSQDDASIARDAMKYFHNQAVNYSGYNLSLDQLIDKVGGKFPAIFLSGFGFAINNVGLSEKQLKSAMENLANQGRGQIPANQSAWFSALSTEAQNINWVSAVPTIVQGVASDVVHGAVAVGETVQTTLSSLNVLFPLVVVGGILFIAQSRIRKLA